MRLRNRQFVTCPQVTQTLIENGGIRTYSSCSGLFLSCPSQLDPVPTILETLPPCYFFPGVWTWGEASSSKCFCSALEVGSVVIALRTSAMRTFKKRLYWGKLIFGVTAASSSLNIWKMLRLESYVFSTTCFQST